MIQEDKALLLKDICARLPYGIKVGATDNDGSLENVWGILWYNTFSNNVSLMHYIEDDCKLIDISEVKPYLFPLSSMTEEQLHELKDITAFRYEHNTLELVKWTETHKTLEFWLEEIPQYEVVEVFDWLNKNHFDYRGLIEKGLAIDATGQNIY